MSEVEEEFKEILVSFDRRLATLEKRVSGLERRDVDDRQIADELTSLKGRIERLEKMVL